MKTNAIQHLLKAAVLGLTTAATLFSTAAGAADVVSTVAQKTLSASHQAPGHTWKSVATQTINAG